MSNRSFNTLRFVGAALALTLGASLTPEARAQGAPDPRADATGSPPSPADQRPTPTAGDPFEHVNRAIFGFNEAVDKSLLEPTAKGYRAFTPTFFRAGVENFLHNLSSPVLFANDVMQASPTRAGLTAGRFIINSSVGLGGLFDVAEHVGWPGHDTDFGITLGRWGAGPGPYIVLPLLGPSNLRDAAGQVVDIGVDPINYVRFPYSDAAVATRIALTELSARADAIDAIDATRRTSIDVYASERSLYDQARESAISKVRTGAADSPESVDTLSH